MCSQLELSISISLYSLTAHAKATLDREDTRTSPIGSFMVSHSSCVLHG